MIKTAKTDTGAASSALRPLAVACRLALIVPLLWTSTAWAQLPEPARQDLLAVGPLWREGEWLYLARVQVPPALPSGSAPLADGPGITTQIYRRTLNRDFRPFGKSIPRRVLAITPLGDQLAVLTDDGNWLLQTEAGVILGVPLEMPDARLLDLASNRTALYAIARVRGGAVRLLDRPGTAPASAQANSASAPSSRPATAPTRSLAPGQPSIGPGPTDDSAGPEAPATRATTSPATTAPDAAVTTATTAPSTTSPSTVATTTGPASRPQQNLPDMLSIVLYSGGQWTAVSDIPPEIANPIDPVSLLVYGDTPIVLVRESPSQIRLWRLDGTRWREIAQATIPASTRIARLVPGGVKPTVWLSPALDQPVEPDHIMVFDAAGLGVTRSVPRQPETQATEVARPTTASATQPSAGPTEAAASRPTAGFVSGLANEMKLATTGGVPPMNRAVAFAFNYFRTITLVDQTMSEQAYDALSFAPVEAARSQTFTAPGLPYLDIARYTLVAIAMVFAIVLSLRRRTELNDLELDPSTIPLAPLVPRLMAGVIDAAPLIVSLFVSFYRLGPDADDADLTEANLIVAAGIVAYVAITTIIETLAGRSAGKMMFGLRVISVTGKPATKGQLATRNLLRVIDVLLSFFPLFLIPFSPLRQRAGDAAAATMVVTTRPPEEAGDEQT